METFMLKSVYVNSKYIRFLYPLLFLGVVIFVSTNSIIKFKDTGLVALAGIALVGWTVYDILKIVKMKKYVVTLDEKEININDEYILKWNEISNVDFYSIGFGMQEIIVFNNNKKIKIPAVIENLELLKNKIKSSVSENCAVVEH